MNDIIPILSRVLHILPAMVLVGGLFYLRTMVVPVGGEDYYAGRRAAWARTVGICTLLLLGSGFYNFMGILNQAKEVGEKLPSAYHMLFGIKFLLALLVMFIAAILSGKTAAAERFRGQMGKWLNIAKFAILAIVILAAVMRTHRMRTLHPIHTEQRTDPKHGQESQETSRGIAQEDHPIAASAGWCQRTAGRS